MSYAIFPSREVRICDPGGYGGCGRQRGERSVCENVSFQSLVGDQLLIFCRCNFNRLWWYQKPIGFAKPSECLWQCWWSSRPSSPCHWQVLSTWPFWPQNNSQNPPHRCCVVRQLWEGGMNYSGWGQNNPSICQHQSLCSISCTNMTTSVNPPFSKFPASKIQSRYASMLYQHVCNRQW